MSWRRRGRVTCGLTASCPATPLSLLLDKNSTNLATQVEFKQFNRSLNAVNCHIDQHTGRRGETSGTWDADARQLLVAQQASARIDNVRVQAAKRLGAELGRLQTLQGGNPPIRDDELGAVAENRRQVLKHLDEVSWRWMLSTLLRSRINNAQSLPGDNAAGFTRSLMEPYHPHENALAAYPVPGCTYHDDQ